MTIQEAIAEVDSLKPNLYEEGEKIRWLSRLDSRIWQDIVLTHERLEGETPESFTPYTVNDGETELLAGEPYDEMYVSWLAAQLDYNNMEFDSFNNSNAVFESLFTAFRNAYNRTHMPKAAYKTYY